MEYRNGPIERIDAPPGLDGMDNEYCVISTIIKWENKNDEIIYKKDMRLFELSTKIFSSADRKIAYLHEMMYRIGESAVQVQVQDFLAVLLRSPVGRDEIISIAKRIKWPEWDELKWNWTREGLFLNTLSKNLTRDLGEAYKEAGLSCPPEHLKIKVLTATRGGAYQSLKKYYSTCQSRYRYDEPRKRLDELGTLNKYGLSYRLHVYLLWKETGSERFGLRYGWKDYFKYRLTEKQNIVNDYKKRMAGLIRERDQLQGRVDRGERLRKKEKERLNSLNRTLSKQEKLEKSVVDYQAMIEGIKAENLKIATWYQEEFGATFEQIKNIDEQFYARLINAVDNFSVKYPWIHDGCIQAVKKYADKNFELLYTDQLYGGWIPGKLAKDEKPLIWAMPYGSTRNNNSRRTYGISIP